MKPLVLSYVHKNTTLHVKRNVPSLLHISLNAHTHNNTVKAPITLLKDPRLCGTLSGKS